jgi:hypothetical protein
MWHTKAAEAKLKTYVITYERVVTNSTQFCGKIQSPELASFMRQSSASLEEFGRSVQQNGIVHAGVWIPASSVKEIRKEK